MKYVCYQCSARKRKGNTVCKNKEIRREYVEDFILKEIAKIVFDDTNIPHLIKNYYKYHDTFDDSAEKELKNLEQTRLSIEQKIANIINAIALSGSTSLLETLNNLEIQKDNIIKTTEETKTKMTKCNIDENMIEIAYKHAKNLFENGDMDERRQLLNLYLDKVVVFYEHIEIYLNTLPINILQKEVDKIAEGFTGNGESLLAYAINSNYNFGKINDERFRESGRKVGDKATKCERKMADNNPVNGLLSTKIGKEHEFDTKCTPSPCSRLLCEHPCCFPFVPCAECEHTVPFPFAE